jgi:catechol 2,3-dioxygenase-like lactoylglutathione lyase family enzyme
VGVLLHHIAVNCADLDRSVRFYTEALDTKRVYRWDAPPLVSDAAFIELAGGGWIELFADGTPVLRGQTDVGLSHFAIAVPDVAAATERVVAAGGTLVDGPATRTLHGDPPVEATMAFVIGLDGETIELYRNEAFGA